MSSDDTPAGPLNGLDGRLADLRARFPHTRIWYVRNAVTRTVTWCAQPDRYPLVADGPEELAEAIAADSYGDQP